MEGTKRILGTDKKEHENEKSKTITKEGSTTGHYKVGKPYVINGTLYTPSLVNSYDKTGIASWYGPKFDKKLTANGETFYQDEVSAAHKTLPLPSIVKVINLDNNKTLYIRVNDRGPFVNNRIIDLSKQAAIKLEVYKKGTEKVRVLLIDTGPHLLNQKFLNHNYLTKYSLKKVEEKEDESPYIANKIYLQIGAFSELNNAKIFLDKVKNKLNFSLNLIIHEYYTTDKFYKVLIGPYNKKKSAKNVADKLTELGYNYIYINNEG